MSRLSIFLITLFSIFLLSEASMIFEKVKMDKIRYDLFSAAASMAGYIFKDLQRVRLIVFFFHHVAIETGAVARVTGCSHLAYLCQDRVIIAVCSQ